MIKNAKQPLAVAYGGGRNSTAMLIGMADRGVAPDIITFADTGGEKPETYAYTKRFSEWCEKNLGVGITMVAYAPKDVVGYTNLEGECVTGRRLPSLAYGFKTCSQKWKQRPQERFMRTWGPAVDVWSRGEKVRKAIGYDMDEPHRGQNLEDKKYDFWFPLRDWGWGLDECKDVIRSAGLCEPPKSSCFFCPAMKKQEVIQLSISHPDLFDRAVAMERGAAEYSTTVKGLGRRWSWESLAKAQRDQSTLAGFLDPADEPCGCWDGE